MQKLRFLPKKIEKLSKIQRKTLDLNETKQSTKFGPRVTFTYYKQHLKF